MRPRDSADRMSSESFVPFSRRAGRVLPCLAIPRSSSRAVSAFRHGGGQPSRDSASREPRSLLCLGKMREVVAKIALALLILQVATPSVSTAQTASAARPADPIRYTIRFPAPHTHYMDVTAAVPTGGKPDIELMMAVWTPGSYLVREYQRNIERVTATGAGRSLAVAKSDKNRWRIATGGAATVTVTYGVYAHELSVRTNWVEERYALINGAPTFMTLADGVVRPHEVTLDLPAAWRGSMTGLRALAGA